MADVQISVTEADVQIAVIDQENTQLALAAPDDNQVNIAVPGVQGAPGTVNAAADGTAAAPGISFASDTNVGLFRPTADNIGITTGGVERLRIDSVGQVLINWRPLKGKTHISDYTNGVSLTGAAATYTLSDDLVNHSANVGSSILYIGNGFILPKGYTNTVTYSFDVIGGAFSLIFESSIDGSTWTALTTHSGGTTGNGSYAFSSLASTTALRFRFVNSNGTTGRIRVSNIVIPGLTPTQIEQGVGVETLYRSLATPGIYGYSDTNTSIQFPGSDVITFNEGGTEAARIDASGRLGIGTNNPSSTLHVWGNALVAGTNQATLSVGSGGTLGPHSINVNGGGVGTNFGYQFDGNYRLYTNTNTGTNTNIASNSGNIIFLQSVGGSERARFDTSGRLGIGTSAPGNTLEVIGNLSNGLEGKGTINITSNTTTNNGFDASPSIGFSAPYSTGGPRILYGAVAAGKLNANSGNTAGYLSFYTSPASSTGVLERVRITDTGRVGIGTTAPGAKLDVISDSISLPPGGFISKGVSDSTTYGVGNALVLGSNDPVANNTVRIDFFAPDGGNRYTGAYMGIVAGTVTSGPANIVFGRRTSATTNQESVRIDSSGRLLVGTTSAVNNANIQAATSVSVGGLTKREFAKSLSLTDNTSATVFTFAIPGGSSQTSFTGVGGEISYIVFVGRETSTRNARATYGKVQFAISRFWESSANNPVAVNLVSTNQSLVTSNGAAPTITWAITTDAGIDSAAKNVYIAITVDNPFTNLLSTSFEGTISYHTRSFADVTLT